jgi:hypothetical protein
MSVTWSTWWTGLTVFVSDPVFPFVLLTGWLLISLIQILLIRRIFDAYWSLWLLYWASGVFIPIGLYYAGEYIPLFVALREFVLPIVYGIATGYALEQLSGSSTHRKTTTAAS